MAELEFTENSVSKLNAYIAKMKAHITELITFSKNSTERINRMKTLIKQGEEYNEYRRSSMETKNAATTLLKTFNNQIVSLSNCIQECHNLEDASHKLEENIDVLRIPGKPLPAFDRTNKGVYGWTDIKPSLCTSDSRGQHNDFARDISSFIVLRKTSITTELLECLSKIQLARYARCGTSRVISPAIFANYSAYIVKVKRGVKSTIRDFNKQIDELKECIKLCYELLDKVKIWQISINNKSIGSLRTLSGESAKSTSNVPTEAEAEVLARKYVDQPPGTKLPLPLSPVTDYVKQQDKSLGQILEEQQRAQAIAQSAASNMLPRGEGGRGGTRKRRRKIIRTRRR
jgi:hypothetical protein